jgi:penicillin-binding protein 2
MPNLYAIKDHFKESQLYLNRTVVALFIVVLLTSVLVGRLVFLQKYQHTLYKTLSLNNQVRIAPITAARGLILDRNGILLAENIPAFSLEITPERTTNLENTVNAIDKIIPLTENERRLFFKQVKYKRKNESIPLRLKLTEVEVAKFSVEKHHFSGVEIVARLIRHYPYPHSLAHALGYIGPISENELTKIDPANYRGTYYIGKNGLERFYETELHGTTGYHHIETDAKGRTIRTLNKIPPKAGENLHLSLDIRLQEAAFQALNDLKGAIVAVDPKTGGILALVSQPSFDPNLFAQGIDADNYKQLQSSVERPLFNRAVRGKYPPGSTVKPIIALQALDLRVVTPEYQIFDPGWYQLNGRGRLYRDWIYFSKKHGHGYVDLEKAIIQSCDTYFFTIAHRLGIHALHEILTRFGLGTPTGIDITGEESGLVPSVEWKRRAYNDAWYPGDTLNVGIGQGAMLVTPLQMAQVAATFANKGICFKPHLVTKRTRLDDSVTVEYPAELQRTVPIKDLKNWDLLLNAMQGVVHSPSGTAHRINHGLQYKIVGKTGTSQVFNLKQNEKYNVHNVKAHLRDHTWFIGFAPAENPSIALAVLVENTQKKAAKDVARVVFDSYFNAKAIAVPELSEAEASDENEENVTGEVTLDATTEEVE